MKLLRVSIQDGESVYYEYYKIGDNEIPQTSDYADGFLKAVKNFDIINITEKELKVLEKFRII